MHASANISADASEDCLLDTAQANKPAGVRSPTVLALHSAGWLLLLCLFLPVCRSCGGTIVRPADNLLEAPAQFSDVISYAAFVGSYSNGVLIAFLVTLSVFLGRDFWWRSFLVQFALTICIGSAIVALIIVNEDRLKDWTAISLVYLPPFLAVITWVGLAIRNGEQERAWARLQHAWTIGAWITLHLCCILNSELLFGYWLTLFAIAGQFFAVQLTRHRIHHDLWDASQPTRRPQFTLGGLLAWMTILPLIVAYYQAVGPVVDWLFPEG